MKLLAALGHVGTFSTIVSSIYGAIQLGSEYSVSQKLKYLRGTLDFSNLPSELSAVLDKAESYLAEKKQDIQGGILFLPEERAEFAEDFFRKYSDTLPYKCEVEQILSDYIDQSESYLLLLMSPGEKAIYRKGQQIKTDTEQIKADTTWIRAMLEKQSIGSPAVPSASPNSVPKISYEIPSDYIPRKVVPHEVAILNQFERVFQSDRPISLTEALGTNRYLLLLSDAAHGKSTELQNLAGTLFETAGFPFLYPLSLYCGGSIPTLLSESYRNLPSEHLTLLFDGYDEMQAAERDEFMRRLQSFIKDNASVKVVISSRSNFCHAEIENQSKTFQGFQVYHLEDLSGDDIRDYVSRQAVDTVHFSEAVEQSGTASLLKNPFYLTRLVRLYQKRGQLPGKAEVMDYLITESFQLDDLKFQGRLEDRQRDLFVLLEKAAFAMQLTQKSSLDDSTEYQELFTLEERTLLKYSGLLQKEGTNWRFTHNNFKEYLSAKYLSRLPQDESICYFSDGYDIKMSWVNTFGFFLNMELEWDLKSWVFEHAPAALIKFNPDHLESDVRMDIFKSVFLERERAMLWLSDSLYSLEELAAFACCEEALEFLLDKIRRPVHQTSQISAIQLLLYFSRLFGRREEAKQVLLACCTVPSNNNTVLCFNALEALSRLKLVTPEIAGELVAKYENCPDTYVRWVLYRLLVRSGQHNAHVRFFLDGIAYIRGNNRISTETTALMDGLQALTEPESIRTALFELAQPGRMTFFEEDDVYETLCDRAAEQFLQGQAEYHQTLIESYIAAAKHAAHRKTRAIVHFFEITGTIENAVGDLGGILGHTFYLDALFSHPENITYAEKAYTNGTLENHKLFQDIVQRYADDAQYQTYKNLILEIDGVTLPERKPCINYEELRQVGTQKYFDMLFDKATMEQMLLLAIQKTALPDPTLKDLVHSLVHSPDGFQDASPLSKLCFGLHRYFHEASKARDVFQVLDWTQFVVSETATLIQHSAFLQVSDEQKSVLCGMLSSLYAQGILENAVTYNGDSTQISQFAAATIFLTVYLELVPEETVLLQMTEFPDFCFSENDDTLKYAFLKSHLSEETLRRRIIENVNGGKVHATILRDHIQYCGENGWEDIRTAAIKAAKTDGIARTAGIEYLYNIFGTYCIQKDLLPEADQDMLLDIERLCPDLPKEQLRAAMEREFQTPPSLELMAHLLTLGSEAALREYIRLAERDKAPPENDRNSLNGPTEAISSLRNPELLPLLEKLMEIALSPDFQDGNFCSLRSNLSNALTGCGDAAPEKVMTILASYQETADKNGYAFRFCSYTMDSLRQKMRIRLDAPWSLCDVKRILKAIS